MFDYEMKKMPKIKGYYHSINNPAHHLPLFSGNKYERHQKRMNSPFLGLIKSGNPHPPKQKGHPRRNGLMY